MWQTKSWAGCKGKHTGQSFRTGSSSFLERAHNILQQCVTEGSLLSRKLDWTKLGLGSVVRTHVQSVYRSPFFRALKFLRAVSLGKLSTILMVPASFFLVYISSSSSSGRFCELKLLTWSWRCLINFSSPREVDISSMGAELSLRCVSFSSISSRHFLSVWPP